VSRRKLLQGAAATLAGGAAAAVLPATSAAPAYAAPAVVTGSGRKMIRDSATKNVVETDSGKAHVAWYLIRSGLGSGDGGRWAYGPGRRFVVHQFIYRLLGCPGQAAKQHVLKLGVGEVDVVMALHPYERACWRAAG
jgi:hypothetical protein